MSPPACHRCSPGAPAVSCAAASRPAPLEWLQLERDPSEVPELKCLCGIPACCRTARNERNHMRRFLHCDVIVEKAERSDIPDIDKKKSVLNFSTRYLKIIST
ncbi:hypothetical protein PVAP13_6NG179209 [Panicum virgatum]|uniref:Uncharacterized protein n=1 Tax=Panicum virgatum TaxID=38727 RepID=A0A8T0QXD4_PANVG|nr:hypothetical protein PVAP13_6NG179209 [Panicum virgatum]